VTIGTFLVLSLSLIGCFLALVEVENEGTKLWVDQHSRPKQNEELVGDLFERPPRPASLIMTAKEEGDNVLTLAAIREALEVHDEILAARTENGLGLLRRKLQRLIERQLAQIILKVANILMVTIAIFMLLKHSSPPVSSKLLIFEVGRVPICVVYLVFQKRHHHSARVPLKRARELGKS
jgi:hypothetical protein